MTITYIKKSLIESIFLIIFLYLLAETLPYIIVKYI